RNAAAEAFHEVSAHVESHGTLVLSLAGGVDAEAALAHIARHEQLFAQHRCLRRIHAYALRRAGESERADRIEDELGEPSESFEAYLLGQIATFAIGREPGAAERAVHYLALAVALADSPRFEFYVQLALAARHADDAEAARTTARVLESRFADRPDVWESVGHARAVFDPAGARAAFERACELEPTAIHYGNLAGAALVLEDYEAAEAASRRGLECDAGSAFVRGGLVLALAGQARHAEAVAEAEATLKVDPGRTIVLAALFDGCRELGELGRAVPSLARCARALPAAIEPRLLLATCLVESDRAELVAKAATVLDEIDRLAPAPEQQAAAAELRRRLDAR
ncbi:MAG: hypothetical protein KDE27_23400, partial [Planctomycetes bacterium]|nr:hypothetical protein [Planctomycetota bacterium]